MRSILLMVTALTALAAMLAAGATSAKSPKACHRCPAVCGSAVSACVDASSASCPASPKAKARKCLKKAKHQCKKTIDRFCASACKQTGTPVCGETPSTTTTTEPGSTCFTDGGDGTIHDSCTGLQWEKKTGSRGVQAPTNLHDINHVHPWSGTCARNRELFCQPDAASAATCAARADGTTAPEEGCSECPGGDYDATTNPSGTGPCVGPSGGTGSPVTIWVWLNRLNAVKFAGHDDWRIPSQAARNSCPPGEPNCTTAGPPRELDTIVRGAPASCSSPCTYPIFGVPVGLETWSSSTASADHRYAWVVNFFDGKSERNPKNDTAVSVRAVRSER